MAYNKGYNPDALPAHAEPEQAAAILSQSGQSSRPQPPPRDDRYASKPVPPPPVSSLRADDRYSRPAPAPSPSYSDTSGRSHSPRYNNGYDDRRYDDRYGAGGHGGLGPGSPPPANYGYDRPPSNFNHGRPPLSAGHRPPATPAPPRDGNDRDALWRLYRAVDKDNSGKLSQRELQAALVNGDWTPFDPHTVRMMIRMFDTDRSGSVNFDEFCGLWGFLSAWRSLFDRFDADRSGNISLNEFTDALVAFGYRLSPQFVGLLFQTYDRRREGAISFDMFVQACISLKRMTDVFKKYDDDRDGYITLSFEEFLTEIIRQAV